MGTTNERELLEELAAMREAYVERVRRWPDEDGEEEEDVVQDAFARATANAGGLRDGAYREEWFYRVLRSAYVDHRRRTAARRRMLVGLAREVVVARQAVPDPPELSCACVGRAMSALRADYRSALEAFELGGCTLAELAASAGITPNNAGVRVHRARVALARLTRECCRGCRTSLDGCCCATVRRMTV